MTENLTKECRGSCGGPCGGDCLPPGLYEGGYDDKRYVLMHQRLSQLRVDQLQLIVDNINIVLFDKHNYNDGKFCPMGVALRCHELPNQTDLSVKEMIGKRFTPTNMIKGVEGKFYHGTDEERKADLLWLCRTLIYRKK